MASGAFPTYSLGNHPRLPLQTPSHQPLGSRLKTIRISPRRNGKHPCSVGLYVCRANQDETLAEGIGKAGKRPCTTIGDAALFAMDASMVANVNPRRCIPCKLLAFSLGYAVFSKQSSEANAAQAGVYKNGCVTWELFLNTNKIQAKGNIDVTNKTSKIIEMGWFGWMKTKD